MKHLRGEAAKRRRVSRTAVLSLDMKWHQALPIQVFRVALPPFKTNLIFLAVEAPSNTDYEVVRLFLPYSYANKYAAN
jgi:hypothetical protein